jgi:hypothetical protein
LLQRIIQEAGNLERRQVKAVSALRKDIDQCGSKHVKQKSQSADLRRVAPCISFWRVDKPPKYSKTCQNRTPYIPETWTNGK